MSFTLDQIFSIWFVLLGAAVGSFLNAAIYRLPRGFLLTLPTRSMCTKCVRRLTWYENIPLLSFLLLRGKCHGCGQKIDFRYFFIEFITALLFYAVYKNYGATLQTLLYCFFTASLVAVTFIDVDFRVIPDEISIGGTVLALIASIFIPQMGFVNALVGAFSGSLVLYILSFAYEKIRHREGMGLGDVKLLMLIGAVLGIKGALGSIIISSLVGSIVGIAIMIFQKKDLKLAIPFGPFLAIGAFVFMFWGDSIQLSLYSG